ncbi:hypothetical protein V8F20_012412 [Naviculisporaceae sp. PSN 640]
MSTPKSRWPSRLDTWRLLVLLLFFCHLGQAASSETDPQLLYELDAFSQMKVCAQRCFWYNSAGCAVDLLGDELACPYGYCKEIGQFGAPNQCYCRSDNMPAAGTLLSSCIKSACTVGNSLVDISSALGLYSGYCSSLGFRAGVVDVPATTTDGAGVGGGSVATPTITVAAPTTVSSVAVTSNTATLPTAATINTIPEATNSAVGTAGISDAGGSNTGDKIALGVGLGVGIPAVLVALVLGIPPCIHAIRQLQKNSYRHSTGY